MDNVVGVTEPAPVHLLVGIAEDNLAAFFPGSALDRLTALGEVSFETPARLLDDAAFAEAARGAQIFVTAWGFPALTGGRLAAAPQLALVAHAASSLRAVTTPEFWQAGIPITQSGAAMAPAVAELALTMTLSLLRGVPRYDHALRTGAQWESARGAVSRRPREISGARIGVVGASRVGRAYAAAAQALGAQVRVFDPYLAESDPLGPSAGSVADLCRGSDVLAVHAPALAETEGLVGAGELAALPDGAVVVNTARQSIVDDAALFAAAAAGRIDVGLDVFDDEPLPLSSPWRALPNVLLTPHVAGATVQSRRRGGEIVIAEIERHLRGERLQHRVEHDAFLRMA
ncbi:hydroxyacid dehydrogenase [Microbacterium sp. 22303]|uniref:hydroxyacid dehydrogenase n=1 Tax=Microbacterium sp. 22303 TaxID=3453905 RepID=UPI003F829AE2